MITQIDRTLALQIVNTVKDVCGQDINFINKSGIIFASTNSERMETYHEIGHKAAQTNQTIEVTSDDTYTGTQNGINLPIYHNNILLAVIGITGEPDKVRKYAHLAERITNLLIREREINMFSRSQADKKHFVIDSLIRKSNTNMNYLNDCLKEFSIDIVTPKRLILIKIDTRYNIANLSLLEQKITQMFHLIPLQLYTFHYPNEYLAVIDDEIFKKNSSVLQHFAMDYRKLLKVTVGKSGSIYQLADSYSSAVTAWKSITDATEGFLIFDDLTLEIILSSLTSPQKEEFLSKTIAFLSEDERILLKTYYQEDMSLLHTCEQLFLHKNTLQYKLNGIEQKCGLNPRKFKDAVLLYLALKLYDS